MVIPRLTAFQQTPNINQLHIEYEISCSFTKVFEPSELQRGYFTDVDQEIRVTDMPERFQLRGIPVSPTAEGELQEEAEWIHKYAFSTPPVSRQEFYESEHGGRYDRKFTGKGPDTVERIREALGFMRNQQFEVRDLPRSLTVFLKLLSMNRNLNSWITWSTFVLSQGLFAKPLPGFSRKNNLSVCFELSQQFRACDWLYKGLT